MPGHHNQQNHHHHAGQNHHHYHSNQNPYMSLLILLCECLPECCEWLCQCCENNDDGQSATVQSPLILNNTYANNHGSASPINEDKRTELNAMIKNSVGNQQGTRLKPDTNA